MYERERLVCTHYIYISYNRYVCLMNACKGLQIQLTCQHWSMVNHIFNASNDISSLKIINKLKFNNDHLKFSNNFKCHIIFEMTIKRL